MDRFLDRSDCVVECCNSQFWVDIDNYHDFEAWMKCHGCEYGGIARAVTIQFPSDDIKLLFMLRWG